MIENIVELGKLMKGNKDEVFYSNINIDKDDSKRNYVEEIVFEYKTNDCKVSGILQSVNKMNSKDVSKYYHWIGNTRANYPKIRVTSDNFYNVECSLPNILKKLKNKNSDLYQKISWVVENYFEEKEEDGKKVMKIRPDRIDKNNQIRVIKEVKLYTIKIGDELICKHEEYLDLIKGTVMPDENLYVNGVCSICMKNDKVTSDTSHLQFKYYVTDKFSFASNFESFENNLSLCKECYENAIYGENFILKNFHIKFDKDDLVIIPRAIIEGPNSLECLDYAYKFTKTSINGQVEDFSNFRALIKNQEENCKIFFVINLLFYKSGNQSFKVNHLIQDVSLFNVEKINRELEESRTLVDTFDYSINLSSLYGLLKWKDREVAMNYIIKIFKGEDIDKGRLINDFMQSEKARMHEKNISKKDSYEQFLLMIKFIFFMINMQLFKYDNEVMRFMDNELNDGSKRPEDAIIEKLGLDEQRESLVRLGFLISQISYAQYNSGLKNSPILEKINFNGTDIKGIMRLVTSVEEKMKQYKLFYYKTNVMDLQKLNLVIARDANQWGLNNNENIFYIMSGYSILMAKIIKSSPEKAENEEIEVNETDVEL